MRDQSPLSSPPFHTWRQADGQLWCEFHRQQGGYLLRFPTLADFSVSTDGQQITAWPTPAIDTVTLEHLYLNQVLPLALSQQQALVLHGSAVVIGNDAVAFLGRSGQGKSTLAAAFAAAGKPFLTDDGLRLLQEHGQYQVVPGHASIRLWQDSCERFSAHADGERTMTSYSSKVRILASPSLAHTVAPQPLRCLYWLKPGETGNDAVHIQACNGNAAMQALLSNCFVLDVEERDLLSSHFTTLSALARQVPVFELQYPRRFELLPAVVIAIETHTASLQ